MRYKSKWRISSLPLYTFIMAKVGLFTSFISAPSPAAMPRLNSVLPEDLKIIDVYDDFRDNSEIVYSDYVYKFEFADNDLALEKIKNVLSSDEILALKKGKQGRKRVMKETNIKSFIDKYSISIRNDVIVLNIRLLAGPEKNLNPSLLFDTIIRLIDMDFEWKSIARISLLDKDYKEFK